MVQLLVVLKDTMSIISSAACCFPSFIYRASGTAWPSAGAVRGDTGYISFSRFWLLFNNLKSYMTICQYYVYHNREVSIIRKNSMKWQKCK